VLRNACRLRAKGSERIRRIHSRDAASSTIRGGDGWGVVLIDFGGVGWGPPQIHDMLASIYFGADQVHQVSRSTLANVASYLTWANMLRLDYALTPRRATKDRLPVG
jgi:hypothetical protein